MKVNINNLDIIKLKSFHIVKETLSKLERQLMDWKKIFANTMTNKELISSQTPYSNNTSKDSLHGHHQMVNTEIGLIIFFAAKGEETLYSQQK